MNKKNSSIALSVILIICFFLPYISAGPFQMSGYDIVFGKNGVQGISGKGSALMVSLLVPIGALVVLLGAALNDSFGKGTFVRFLPLIGLAYIVTMLFVTARITPTVSEMLGWMGYGFWVSLAAAVALPFFKE